MRTRIDILEDKIRGFFERKGIKRLSLFSSALRNDFTVESDVDVLVEFRPRQTPGLAFFGSMPDDLLRILGCRGDLNTEQCLSPYFYQKVLGDAKVIYVES